jgi:iron complex outermembrane receptor protein
MAAAGYKKNKFTVFASINYDKTDGHRANSDFSITNGYIKMGYALSDHLRITADLSIAGFNATDPGPDTLNALPGNTIDIMRGYGALTIDNDFQYYSGSARLFYNFGEHQISDGFHSNDVNFGMNLFESLSLFDNNSITVGFDFIHYGGIAENINAMGGEGIIFTDTAVYETGIYGLMQHTFLKKLTLNAGIRYQNHRVLGNNWIPSTGLAYRMSDRTTWKASVAKGYRSPSIRELFIAQWGGNPGLKPDQIINYEIGLHHVFRPANLNVELTAFLIEGENMIVSVPLQGLKNSGRIENKGIEFSANAQPASNLKLSMTYSYINMKEPVYATPEHQLFISGRYKHKKISLIPRLQVIRNIDTDPGPEAKHQNYVSLNLKTTYKLTGFAEISASCENLLNQKYEINRNYPMPGITVFAGINLRY